MTEARLRSKPATVALNRVEFRRLCAVHQLHNDRVIATAMGIRHSTVWRTATGATGPSERFIGGALRAFPDSTFDQLFKVVDYHPRKRPAG